MDVVTSLNNTNKPVDPFELCKLCLKSTNLKHFSTSRYASEFNNFNFIEVQIGYSLPENICSDCIAELDKIASFIKMCRHSYSVNESINYESRNIKYEQEDQIEDEITISETNLTLLDKIKTEEPCDEDLQDNSIHKIVTISLFKCKICNVCFSNKDLLKEHMQTHEETNEIVKSSCQNEISQMDQTHLQTNNKIVLCSLCPRSFINTDYLQQHMFCEHTNTTFSSSDKEKVVIPKVCKEEFEFEENEETQIVFLADKMSDSEMECTSQELRESAQKLNLLPEKSRLRYEKTYRDFRDWCSKNGVEKYTSERVILTYFGDVAKTKKPSSLWSRYSMLRSTFNFNDNVEISKYAKLIAYLKKQNVGYQPKKSSIFTRENIDNFLNNAPFEYLPHKVALIIGISGACRSDELFKMKTDDVELQEQRAIIVLPNTKTIQPRSFVVTDNEWVEILKCYVNLRNNIEGNRFFLQLRHGKLTKQPYGHNSISQFPKKIASYLQLNNANTFTGHCFRRTSTTLLSNGGRDILNF